MQWNFPGTKYGSGLSPGSSVLRYVAGITDIVRPEEWPVMSVHRMGFSRMPFGFFSKNPTMGISNPDFIKKQFPKVEKLQPDSSDPGLEHQ